jgi:hypothetical protein
VRKSLLRLEDAFKVQGKKLEEFARADALRAESEKVERQLHNGLGKLGSAIEQLREGNLGPIETVVRDLQRELASVATGMAQLQQLVRGLGSRAATAPPAPMPATPAAAPPRAKRAAAAEPEAATAPKAAAAEPAEAAPIDTTGLSDAQAGAAQNRTGARSSNSKNVLGAIAKLKQMKG